MVALAAEGVNQSSKDVTGTLHQRPESPTVTLTWRTNKCTVNKLLQHTHKKNILPGAVFILTFYCFHCMGQRAEEISCTRSNTETSQMWYHRHRWLPPSLLSAWTHFQRDQVQYRVWINSRAYCASDCARHFSNRCDIYKVAKVVHRNRSDNHFNRSDTWPPLLLPKLY